MQAFKDYVIEEFRELARGFVGVEFKFSHGVGTKADKKTETLLKIDSVKCNVKFYDKDMNLLCARLLSFENDVVPKSFAKKLVNISADELANRFCSAKNEICKIIMDEYNERRLDITDRIFDLSKYCGGSVNNVTPPEFAGESIQPVGVVTKKKQINFDM